MEGTLKVTPEKLIAASGEFGSIDTQVVSITDEMNNLVNSMKGAWIGEAAEAFTAKFNELNDDMAKIHKKINEHSKDLAEMAKMYQDAEAANIDTGNGLPGDVIE